MAKIIYLDNAATTKVDEKVYKAMQPFFSGEYGNPSSQHLLGREAKEEIEKSRKIIAQSINVENSELIFTSGGTESNNLALKGIWFANREASKNKIITSKIEHDSVLNVCKWLETQGAKIIYLDVDKEGFIDLNQLKNSVDESTLIVSIIQGNNEIGTIQDLESIGKICSEKNVPLHVDACQSFTKIKLDVKKQNISLLTINGHKLHGPKGIGALYIKKEIKLTPLIHGGGHERGIRSGTENVAGIIGFAQATRISNPKDNEKMAKLRDYTIKKLLEIKGSKLNGPAGNRRLSNNINISFGNVEGEAIQSRVEEYGIMISTGSACASNSLKKSHVLRAIGLNDLEINSSIRISLSKYTTKSEIDYLLNKLKIVVNDLRRMSPFN